MTLLKGRTFIVLIVLIIFFSIASRSFLSVTTLTMVAQHVALYGILALGMTFVIITGGISLRLEVMRRVPDCPASKRIK